MREISLNKTLKKTNETKLLSYEKKREITWNKENKEDIFEITSPEKEAIKETEENMKPIIKSQENARKAWVEITTGLTEEEKLTLKDLQNELMMGVEDIEEAKEIISKLRAIIPPIISIEKEKYDKMVLPLGYIPKLPDDTGRLVLPAIIGRIPFTRGDMGRIFFRIRDHVKIIPRFTKGDEVTKKPLFCGVVGVHNNRLNLNSDVEQIQL